MNEKLITLNCLNVTTIPLLDSQFFLIESLIPLSLIYHQISQTK